MSCIPLLEKIKRKRSLYMIFRPPHRFCMNSIFQVLDAALFQALILFIFDSPADTITITHQARNSEGFARGAVAAAEWLDGKKGFLYIR